ncbi:MAG: hypothetical protein JXQ71_17875 [Verrucomicrobia bacterium]|nr:hypothetical protein [Verrucomicrobiota bacterium]
MNIRNIIVTFGLLAAAGSVTVACAQDTIFTYQGRLDDGNAPATGVYDLQFTLWKAASGPSQIGAPVTVNDQQVTNGLFTVSLDFGAGAFEGSARWLEVGVRAGASVGAYEILTPRTRVLPSPYAIYAGAAAVAGTASGVAANAVASSGIADGSITAADLNTASVDGRYVLKAGDTMTGPLTTPDLTVPGTITSSSLRSEIFSLRLNSPGDLEFTIDRDANPALLGFFEVFNGEGHHRFWVNEAGHGRIYGNWTADGTVAAAGFAGDGSGLTSAGLVRTTVLDVTCHPSVSYGTTYTKLVNIGSFTKQLAGSTIELTFNGRVYVGTMTNSATGAVFELRVDDTATTNGRARASLRFAEAGGGGIPTSITGIFTGLGTGTHTVNMWICGSYAGGRQAMLDTGCWGTDHVVVKELK